MAAEGRIIQLDVRPYLRKKLEPFQVIMNTVKALAKDELLLLHATIKPTPLLGLLKMKGYAYRMESAAPDHWMVAFLHKSQGTKRLDEFSFEAYADLEENQREEAVTSCENDSPAAPTWDTEEPKAATGRVTELDNRGLEPPQPMVRTLKALEDSQSGDRVIIHNDRVPMFLIEELQTLGYSYHIAEQSDGSAKVTITKT